MKNMNMWILVVVLVLGFLYMSRESYREYIRPRNPGHCVNNPHLCGND
jgi:hypothetical protein